MSGSILDAIQDLATPAMIKAATSALGVSEAAATSTLAAASTSVLGGLIQKAGDAGLMGKIAALAGGVTPDAGMFSNLGSILSGGVPTSAINVMGNKLLGLVFGDKMAATISAIATATGVSSKVASGLTSLAAPMVLAAIRAKLGAAPTANGLSSMLTADKALVASAMPASLRTMYGLTSAAATPAPAAAPAAAPAPVKPPVSAAPSVAATLPAAAASAAAAAAAAATSAAAKPTAPTAATASGYASATVASTAPAAKPAAPVQAAPAAAPKPAAPAAPMAHAAPAAQKPAAAATSAAHAHRTHVQDSRTNLGAALGLAVPLLLFSALIWYWAYGSAAPKPMPVKTAAAPAAVAPAPTPAPAAAPAAVPAPAGLVPVPGANGLVKYTLPGGAAMEVAKDGLEAKLLGFITGKDAIDNKLWFDFDHLNFVTASSDPTPESKAQLANAVAILKAFPAVSVKIGGYTDNQGDPDANLKLSDSRAKRVMEDIVAGGIAADRIEAKGYGDQFPVGDNATPEGRAKNRRTALSVRSK